MRRLAIVDLALWLLLLYVRRVDVRDAGLSPAE